MDKKFHQNVNSNINLLSSCCFARFSMSVTSGCLSAPSAALSPLSVWIFVFGLVKVPVLILLDEPPIIKKNNIYDMIKLLNFQTQDKNKT